jgi:hypothetical protein
MRKAQPAQGAVCIRSGCQGGLRVTFLKDYNP